MQDRRRQFDEIFLQRTAGPYIRVNLRRTQNEHMFSALPLTTDIERPRRYVRKVPISEVSAAYFDMTKCRA